MSTRPVIVWFGNDLRLGDHPALIAGLGGAGDARERRPIVPVYIHGPEFEGRWPIGGAGRWWLHHALGSLDADLRSHGSRLALRSGDPVRELLDIAAQTGADRVVAGRRYEPSAVEQQERVQTALRRAGMTLESFNTGLLYEPREVTTRQGGPYQVFTPYYKACLSLPEPPAPRPAPPGPWPQVDRWPASLDLGELKLLPSIDWAAGMRRTWEVSESGALRRLQAFARQAARDYAERRDRPGIQGTSRLSPYLRWGLIGPGTIWHALRRSSHASSGPDPERGPASYLRELVWREFAYHLLHHFPHTPERALRERYERFPWRSGPDAEIELRAWQRGRTGFPLVDAGMRELWATGWMHNRVRMVVASFLVKDLLIDWRAGAAWFWETLVDADLASNTLGWQWAAGCGADAAPYFRVFNPLLQSRKFDPEGAYIRRWVPELARLSGQDIHAPHQAPPLALSMAGVDLGSDYPLPIVDHPRAKTRALDALASLGDRTGVRLKA